MKNRSLQDTFTIGAGAPMERHEQFRVKISHPIYGMNISGKVAIGGRDKHGGGGGDKVASKECFGFGFKKDKMARCMAWGMVSGKYEVGTCKRVKAQWYLITIIKVLAYLDFV